MADRVLIVTRWFPPEQAPFGQMMAELARDLVARGFCVDVITSVPSHPAAVVFAGWRNSLYRSDSPQPGLRIIRIGAVARDDAGSPPGRVIRGLAFLWFTVAACAAACLISRPRVIFAVLQPLTIGPALWLVSRLRRTRVIFNVQDLHPDALVDLGLIRQPALIGALRRIESFCYRRADALAVICDGFREHCMRRGADPSRIRVIPNWIDLEEIRPQPGVSSLRRELGLGADDFVALYAGTIGLVSGAEVVVEAAANIGADSGIHVAFVGEGQLLAKLQRRAAELGLPHVRFLPFQPRERLNDVQALADVSLVTLLPGHGRTSVPSKVLGYLAAARPVVAAVDADSETARFLVRAGAGLIVPPNDAQALAEAFSRLRLDPRIRLTMGRAGRRYLERHHSQGHVLGAYAEMFADMVA